ncbi:MAG: hypothetical protein ACRCWF_03790 [Beijerinckiaceae bacterium]
MIRKLLSCLLFAAAVSIPAEANNDQSVIAGEVMREIISGNTVTGRHDSGMPYSEWHAPDGRVFGHNNHEIVEKGCWDIRNDAVCYYYAGGNAPGTFCWSFRRIGESGFRLRSLESGMGASGILQAGNPYDHNDNGKPWTCEPLSSQARSPRYARLSTPAAAR